MAHWVCRHRSKIRYLAFVVTEPSAINLRVFALEVITMYWVLVEQSSILMSAQV